MKNRAILLAAALLLASAAAASATTITFTGSESDFTTQGVLPIQDDGVDTEGFCAGLPLDIGKVYVTNDGTNLYVGFQYARACFCSMNLGLALNTRAGGSTAEPFCRAIDWTGMADAPDFYVYDVIPTTCDGFNYEVLYEANGTGGWNTVHDGSNGLGMFDADGGNFVELVLSLSDLRIQCNSPIGLELWTTQEGCTKPAFDMVANDAEGRSTPSGTCFDIGPCAASHPTAYLAYTLLCPVPANTRSWGGLKTLYR